MGKKKYVKYIGNIVTILALLFVVRKFMKMDIDYSWLTGTRSVSWIVGLSVVYGLIIIVYAWPWRNYVYMLTQTKLPYMPVSLVMAKSNLLKYLPGNVFQYVGRNELAVRKNLKHSQVAFATILDVITNLAAAMILGCILYLRGLIEIINNLGMSFFYLIIIGLFLVVSIIIFLMIKKKEVLLSYAELLTKKENLITIAKNFLFYMGNMLINVLMFIVVLIAILHLSVDMQELYVIMGAYILAWIAGFVVPGAPGGIGIREFVITLLVVSKASEIVLAGMVVYRIINILGDVLGFCFAWALDKIIVSE